MMYIKWHRHEGEINVVSETNSQSLRSEFSMTSRMSSVIFVCALCLGLASTVFAGAWTQKQKGYYLKIAANSLDSRSNYDTEGLEVPKPGMGRLTDFNLAAYVEYGLLDRLTLVTAVPYKWLSDERSFATGTGTERTWGFGDLDLRLRWQLKDRPLVISVAAGGKIPLGYHVDEETRVPLGTGKVDGNIRLLLGRSLHPVPGYLTGEVGYRARSGRYSSEIFYALEAGWAQRAFLFKSYVSGVRTLGACGAMGQTGLVGDQNILKASPGVIYRLRDRLELSLDLIHIVSGCNTTTGTTLSAGITLKR